MSVGIYLFMVPMTDVSSIIFVISHSVCAQQSTMLTRIDKIRKIDILGF